MLLIRLVGVYYPVNIRSPSTRESQRKNAHCLNPLPHYRLIKLIHKLLLKFRHMLQQKLLFGHWRKRLFPKTLL